MEHQHKKAAEIFIETKLIQRKTKEDKLPVFNKVNLNERSSKPKALYSANDLKIDPRQSPLIK